MGKTGKSLCAVLGAVIVTAPAVPAAWAEDGVSARPAVTAPGRLRERDAQAALHEVLQISVGEASERLGDVGAFAVGERYHIGLPDVFLAMRGDWNAVGRSGALARLEEAMNRAAAAVASTAEPLLREKAAELKFYDSVAVVMSGDQAGAKFFAMRARPELEQRLRPVVAEALAGAGAFAALAEAAQAAGQPAKAGAYKDLVIQRTLTGLLDAVFIETGRIEADLRAAPQGRGSPLLEQVFSRGAQTAGISP